VLIIRNVRDADLGRYECKAENAQGLASGNITLSAHPLKPIFESKSQPATPTTKVLSWQTQSLSPVIDYKFRFRQVPTGNESFRKRGKFLWNLLTIPADRDTTGPFHTKSYKLEGLDASSVYEIVIQARNQYGHSDESNVLRFSTPGLSK
jgi:neurotrimin